MKKVIVTLVMILGLGASVSAQSDAFFTQNFSEYREAVDTETPRLPNHALITNQDAPVGTGLLLLAGMGLGYAVLRKKD